MRDAQGNINESMNALQHLWTGKQPANHAPKIIKLHADQLKQPLPPASTVTLSVQASDADNDPLQYTWEFMRDDVRRDGKGKEIPHPRLTDAIIENHKSSVTLRLPKSPGNYRVFVNITDGKGHFATANHPVCIKP